MFDRYHLGPRSVHVTESRNVTEKRAPTDDSVRLLREMEAAARAEVIKSVRVEGNGFNCVAQRMFEASSGDMMLRAIFELNGVSMTAAVRSRDPSELVEALVAEIARVIAVEAVGRSLARLGKAWLR